MPSPARGFGAAQGLEVALDLSQRYDIEAADDGRDAADVLQVPLRADARLDSQAFCAWPKCVIFRWRSTGCCGGALGSGHLPK